MNQSSYLALVRGEQRGLGAMLMRLALRGASLPYGWGVRLRNLAFDRGWKGSHSAGVPVISVGNLTVGGTGKTPCVEYVARWCRDRDLQVAVLSRGYGAEGGRNDEALVLEENCPDVPHLQGPDRVELARVAVEELESEVLILDDGFQHRRLRRDLDLVLIDATCPWGHGYLLPRGLLRESPRSLARAGMVLLTRCDLATAEAVARLRQEVERIVPGMPIAECEHRPQAWVNGEESRPLDSIRDRPLAGFCGLGNPEAFRRTLAEHGWTPVAWKTFPDHHAYTREDVEGLRRWADGLSSGTVIATTQKDLVKVRLARLGDHELWALKIALHVRHGEESLNHKLEEALHEASR